MTAVQHRHELSQTTMINGGRAASSTATHAITICVRR